MIGWLALSLFSLPLLFAAAPKTREDPVQDTLHGVTLTDPYRWLEDQNSPQTRKWIEEQNLYTRSQLDPLPSRSAIRKRMTELLRVEAVSIPTVRRGRYFFSRRTPEREQPVILVRDGLNGKERVLLDPDTLAADHSVSVRISAITDDGRLLAYAAQKGGKDETTIHVMDVETGKLLPDTLAESKWSDVSFTPDKKRFYYSVWGGERPRVFVHDMGQDSSRDREIFGQGYGAEHIAYPEVSEDGRWLLITVFHGSAGDVTELHVQDLSKSGSPIRRVTPDVKASFLGAIVDGRLIVDTNWEAVRHRVMALDLATGKWSELVPQSATATIDGVSLTGGRLFVRYLENVQSRVKVYTPAGKFERDMELPAIGTVSGVNGRWDATEAFYSFNSFHIPPSIYRLDPRTGKSSVWFRQPVPVASGDFTLDQKWFQSKDGTRVPMFLLHKKGIRLDGNNPVLLGGYGGFNVSLTPVFSATAVAWAERGGVYGIANLRGGAEFGEEWHKAGMRLNKQNTFDDFIAAAEFLIREKYTTPRRLAIRGSSNGGLLVGAAMTQRPELFRAVICGYPLLDMIRFQKFLVARFWVPEYGSSDNAAEFRYLLGYSPYHRVEKGTKYPSVLFVSGDGDTRVDPLHARKMAALVQSATGSDRLVLLRYDVQAGHAGGQPASKTIDETTDILSYLEGQLGE